MLCSCWMLLSNWSVFKLCRVCFERRAVVSWIRRQRQIRWVTTGTMFSWCTVTVWSPFMSNRHYHQAWAKIRSSSFDVVHVFDSFLSLAFFSWLISFDTSTQAGHTPAIMPLPPWWPCPTGLAPQSSIAGVETWTLPWNSSQQSMTCRTRRIFLLAETRPAVSPLIGTPTASKKNFLVRLLPQSQTLDFSSVMRHFPNGQLPFVGSPRFVHDDDYADV